MKDHRLTIEMGARKSKSIDFRTLAVLAFLEHFHKHCLVICFWIIELLSIKFSERKPQILEAPVIPVYQYVCISPWISDWKSLNCFWKYSLSIKGKGFNIIWNRNPSLCSLNLFIRSQNVKFKLDDGELKRFLLFWKQPLTIFPSLIGFQ